MKTAIEKKPTLADQYNLEYSTTFGRIAVDLKAGSMPPDLAVLASVYESQRQEEKSAEGIR